MASVVVDALSSAGPLAAGLLLDLLLSVTGAPLLVYRGFFAAAALLQALSFLPLRRFRA